MKLERIMLTIALSALAALVAGCGSTEPTPPATPATPPAPAGVADELVADLGTRFAVVDTDGGSVLELRDASGATLDSVALPGVFRHARVAETIRPDAISANGATLVLEQPASDASLSRFLVVDTSLTEAPRLVELPGHYDYDAISPNGRTLYLTEHVDATTYRIVPYAIASGALEAPVAVKAYRAQDLDPMQGKPMARVTEPRGEWVYTLYDGGEHAFVHALNASEGFALCIDLPHGVHSRSWSLELGGPGKVIARDLVLGETFLLDRSDGSHRQLTA